MSNIEKALTFLEGVHSRDARLVARNVHPARHVERDWRVADLAGLDASGATASGRQGLEVVRVFEDGDHVVTQSREMIGGDGVSFDVFRFEDGLIVEHWGFSVPAGPPNGSGHTQLDGPTEPRPDADTAANKALVREYYETVHLAGRHDQIDRFMAGDLQIRHEPGARDGVREFKRDLEVLVRDRTINEIKLLLGRGDFVFIAALGTHRGDPCAYIDLYRVQDAKLVEHWGFPMPMPSPPMCGRKDPTLGDIGARVCQAREVGA